MEYIFAYASQVPEPSQEPHLFRDAEVEDRNGELTLKFKGLTEIVLLLTLEQDDAFRRKYPNLVAKNELFMLER